MGKGGMKPRSAYKGSSYTKNFSVISDRILDNISSPIRQQITIKRTIGAIKNLELAEEGESSKDTEP